MWTNPSLFESYLRIRTVPIIGTYDEHLRDLGLLVFVTHVFEEHYVSSALQQQWIGTWRCSSSQEFFAVLLFVLLAQWHILVRTPLHLVLLQLAHCNWASRTEQIGWKYSSLYVKKPNCSIPLISHVANSGYQFHGAATTSMCQSSGIYGKSSEVTGEEK